MADQSEAQHGCETGDCGGTFVCVGCQRTVGYCMGAYDEYPEHCDDCAEHLSAIADEQAFTSLSAGIR